MDPLRREVEAKPLYRDQPFVLRIVRTKHRPQHARANLMEDPKRTEGIFWRGAGNFRVQWKTPREAG